jgi:hypothetical protein
MDEECLGRAARHEVAGSEPSCDLRQMCLTAGIISINGLFIYCLLPFTYLCLPIYIYISIIT